MWQWIGAPRRGEADGARSATTRAAAAGDLDVTDPTLDAATSAEATNESEELLAAWAADEGLMEADEEKEENKPVTPRSDEKESSDDSRYDASTDEEVVAPQPGYCRGTLAGWIVGRRRTRGPRGQHGRGQRGGTAQRGQRRGHEHSWYGNLRQGGENDGSDLETGAAACDECSDSDIEWRFDPVMRRGKWHDRRGKGASGSEAAATEGAAVPRAQTASAQNAQPIRCPHHGTAPQIGGDDDAARAHAAVRDERGQTSEGSPPPSRGKRKQPPGSSRDAGGAEGGESLREPD